MITYQQETNLDPQEFKQLLIQSTLGERRPVNDEKRIAAMVKHASLIITARDHDKLIGISRALTDFAYCTYLSDLAVDKNYQKMGIGKQLIQLTKKATPETTLILLAAPAAVKYYPKIGMDQFSECFILRDNDQLK